jgi:hypothetical protein
LNEDWQEEARRELAATKSSRCGWSYQRKGAPCVEPTVLASLALRVSGSDQSREDDLRHSRTSGVWLATLQRPDGSLPVSQVAQTPGWTTPLGILLWSTLAFHDTERDRSVRWLLQCAGENGSHDRDGRPVVGSGAGLAGWPWVEGTHSWVEPTAMAIIALCRAGLGDHECVACGTRLLLDRALPHGGWNCGNTIVFGHELRPQPVPTALSLLALAALHNRSRAVRQGVDYLRHASTALTAPVSLGWSLLALRAHQALPREADIALSQAFADCARRPDSDSVRGLALLLLASAENGLSAFVSLDRPGPRAT